MKFVITGRLDGLNTLISANRAHWSRGANLKANNDRLVRDAIRADLGGWSTSSPIRIRIDWYEPNVKRDPDNVFSAVKFILDGMVEAGVIPDDGQKYVKGISHELHLDRDNPRVEVTIVEVT